VNDHPTRDRTAATDEPPSCAADIGGPGHGSEGSHAAPIVASPCPRVSDRAEISGTEALAAIPAEAGTGREAALEAA
jgi:hypothetical protein